jgi:hypothetical protein
MLSVAEFPPNAVVVRFVLSRLHSGRGGLQVMIFIVEVLVLALADKNIASLPF